MLFVAVLSLSLTKNVGILQLKPIWDYFSSDETILRCNLHTCHTTGLKLFTQNMRVKINILSHRLKYIDIVL